MADSGKAVAVIPARGGSKRLPGKNIRPFFGHPMMAYGISAAIHSALFEKVIVSSDDDEIGRVAEWYGAEFMKRPPELATDSAKSVDVILHVLKQLSARGIEADRLCQILPNCPLVKSEDIVEHGRMFREGHRSFQISVVAYRCVYPQWAMAADAEGRGHWVFGKENLVRSQELSTSYCPSGSVWWARCAELIKQKIFYGDPFHLAQIDANRGIDIDDDEDLQLAELVVRGLTDRDGKSPLEPIARESYLRREPVCLGA